MSARDELAAVIVEAYGESPDLCPCEQDLEVADHIFAAGYRKVFDGDCGLSGIKEPTDREAAEAWMRWANLVNPDGGEPNGVAAMKQMLTEFGYRTPRTITTAEELDALPFKSVVMDHHGTVYHRWLRAGWQSAGPTLGPYRITLPATVLHNPQATS